MRTNALSLLITCVIGGWILASYEGAKTPEPVLKPLPEEVAYHPLPEPPQLEAVDTAIRGTVPTDQPNHELQLFDQVTSVVGSGAVIANGHWLEPPFTISRTDGEVEVNGSLLVSFHRERLNGHPGLDAYRRVAWEYRTKLQSGDRDQAIAAAVAIVDELETIKEPELLKDALRVQVRFDPRGEQLWIPLDIPLPREIPGPRDQAEEVRIRIEDALSRGCAVVAQENGMRQIIEPVEAREFIALLKELRKTGYIRDARLTRLALEGPRLGLLTSGVLDSLESGPSSSTVIRK